jgi:hypothetical protein
MNFLFEKMNLRATHNRACIFSLIFAHYVEILCFGHVRFTVTPHGIRNKHDNTSPFRSLLTLHQIPFENGHVMIMLYE